MWYANSAGIRVHESLSDLVGVLKKIRDEKLAENNLLIEEKENKMKTGNYIVGSLHENDTHISLSARPMPHNSKAEAGREAERLARLSPGKRYVVLQVVGIVEAQALVWG